MKTQDLFKFVVKNRSINILLATSIIFQQPQITSKLDPLIAGRYNCLYVLFVPLLPFSAPSNALSLHLSLFCLFSAFLPLFNFLFLDCYLSKVSWQRAWQIEYPRSFSPDGSAYLSFQSSLMARCGGVVRILSLYTFDLQKYVTVPVIAASGSRSSRTPKSNDGVGPFSLMLR
ncbi:hypothetical protein IW261DRAFT_959028 [Armillaria novae-zelandiae]|uniref:Uncharacterized protein n=1 Tax=Armillaria novae-zelandiae TaxID=153914 RepID=A0AA39PFZ8_9AGAR|nr:hypothetical protein IW261DRAFT_959028 [Armillaria novae-zelandiae]